MLFVFVDFFLLFFFWHLYPLRMQEGTQKIDDSSTQIIQEETQIINDSATQIIEADDDEEDEKMSVQENGTQILQPDEQIMSSSQDSGSIQNTEASTEKKKRIQPKITAFIKKDTPPPVEEELVEQAPKRRLQKQSDFVANPPLIIPPRLSAGYNRLYPHVFHIMAISHSHSQL